MSGFGIQRVGSHEYQLTRDDAKVWSPSRADEVLPSIEWAVNTAAVERLTRDYLLLHAGAVARGNSGMVLPAASGSGKTTLVAGLVRAGFQYFSDEIAAIEPATRRMLPFAKSLCVKAGARQTLQSLYPELAASKASYRPGRIPVWYLPAGMEAWPTESVPVRYIVIPRYVEGAQTCLVPISRSVALEHVLPQSFHRPDVGVNWLSTVIELLRDVDCYRLSIGELDRAVEVLGRLITDR